MTTYHITAFDMKTGNKMLDTYVTFPEGQEVARGKQIERMFPNAQVMCISVEEEAAIEAYYADVDAERRAEAAYEARFYDAEAQADAMLEDGIYS